MRRYPSQPTGGLGDMMKIVFSKAMQHRIVQFVTSKSRMASFLLFTTGYWQLLKYTRKEAKGDEVLRMAAAGSLVTHTCELTFYLVDTVNSRSKISQESLSMMK